MLIQTPGDPGKKCRRNEDRGKNKRDADYRPRYFAHRLERRIARCHPFFDVTFDGFNHNNRIIDNEANGEHETEKRERVD